MVVDYFCPICGKKWHWLLPSDFNNVANELEEVNVKIPVKKEPFSITLPLKPNGMPKWEYVSLDGCNVQVCPSCHDKSVTQHDKKGRWSSNGQRKIHPQTVI